MLAVPAGLFAWNNLQTIAAAKQEASGIAPLGDAMKLIQLTQVHRGLSGVVRGGNAQRAAIRQAKEAEVNQSLAKAEASVAALGKAKLVALLVDTISVIDGIAIQTNILALNAAVEAARAGEQGRGSAGWWPATCVHF